MNLRSLTPPRYARPTGWLARSLLVFSTFALAHVSVTRVQAEEKIKVVTPGKSDSLPQLPAATKPESRRSGSSETTLDVFRRSRTGEVGDGGGFAAPTGRSLDPRAQKILLEAIRNNQSRSLIENDGSTDEKNSRSEGGEVREDGDRRLEDGADSINRNEKRQGTEDASTDRSGRNERDARSGSRTSRPNTERRSTEASSNPFSNPLTERDSSVGNTSTGKRSSGEKILISDPHDARKQLDRDRARTGVVDLSNKERTAMADTIDANRSQQFRNLIQSPDSANAGNALSSAAAGRPAAPDRAAQFRTLLAPNTATAAGNGPSLSSLPNSGVGKPLSAFDAAKPNLGALPNGGSSLPSLSAGSLATPSFIPTPIPPAPTPASRAQPAILPLPRRF